MIRILHVIGSLNSGGSQAMIMNIYRNIDRTKMQFDFIIDRKNELFFEKEIKSLGGKVYTLPSFNAGNVLKYLKAWDVFFKEHPEYKIIHGHVRSTAAIYLSIAKKYGLITIAHSHSTSSGPGLTGIIKNNMQYPIRYIADYMLACSQFAGEWLFGKKACRTSKFAIMNNAIESSKFVFNKNIRLEMREKYNVEGKFVIGHVGRFHPAKNHEFLINLFKEIHEKNDDAVLMLVGEGELISKIKKMVEQFGLTKSVIFTGNLLDIPSVLQAMDVFVMPSLYEGLGVALIEAQASGLPVIVSDTIPKEAFITNLINKIPLNAPVELWIQEIMKNKGKKRKDMEDEIILAGYDIEKNTKKLAEFYFKIVR